MSKFYTYDEALEASIAYFGGDELAGDVFLKKYALKDDDGHILEKTPKDMHQRITNELVRIENKKFKKPLSTETIFNYFDKFKYFIPGGSPMSAIGNKYQVQSLSNCVVIPPVVDSYGGICLTDQQQAQLMKRRMGVGFCISNIRPKGMLTKNAARTTEGIGIFMERFSNTCREVAIQNRRGALMLCISVHHPEIETFIHIKKNLTKVTGANISIKVTDEFMNAVVHNKKYQLRWPIKNPKVTSEISARYIWDQIIDSAWACAEPGVLFWDTMQRKGLSDQYKEINPSFEDTAPNPCGEISMGIDACRLMCINLYSYVTDPFTKHAKFDFELFDKHIQDAQRIMDDIVDLELEAIGRILEKIKNDPESTHIKQVELDIWKLLQENCILGRRTGLGITALGDSIAALGLRYGSEESIKMTEEIYKQLAISSMKSSCLMARELGAFPLYDKKLEVGHPFMEQLFAASPEVKELHEKYGRRNISLTTTAPTGTISTQTQTSSGIEPVYALQYTRRRKISSEDKTATVDFVDQNNDKWQTYLVSHDKFNIWKQVTGESDIKDSPYYKATANSIDWEASVDIQAVAQKWITHSISKTCNLPSNATKELVNKVYLKAWKSGCKGFTIYRDGCRTGVLVENPTTKPTLQKHDAPKRPKTLPCDLYTYKMGSKRFLVVVGLLEGEPYEVFATEGKYDIDGNKTGEITKLKRGHYMVKMHDGEIIVANTDNALSEDEEVITRLVSSNLRHGADVSFIVQQIEKSRGMGSFGKSIARALKGYIKNGVKVHGEVCESCGSENLQRVEGCKTCMQCGVSKCG